MEFLKPYLYFPVGNKKARSGPSYQVFKIETKGIPGTKFESGNPALEMQVVLGVESSNGNASFANGIEIVHPDL